jgi:hypothetical protein
MGLNTPIKFEIAKLLKEKGINIYSEYRYTDFNGIERLEKDVSEIFPYAPTIAEVVMWLYEKHRIWVWVIPFETNTQYYCQSFYKIGQGEEEIILTGKHNHTPSAFDSITEAYEAAITYTLNNLI